MIRRRLVPALLGAALVAAAASAAFAAIARNRDNPGGTHAPAATIVYRPANLSRSTPAPLILDLHPSNGRPAGDVVMTGFDSLADRYGFVVAYLDSRSNPSWNSAGWLPRDDLEFVDSTIDDLIKTQNIDPSRIYATGSSAGAAMAYRVGCELAGKIAAIGIVSGNMGVPDCSPSRPVSVIEIHGTLDTSIPLGGTGTNGGSGPGQGIQAVAVSLQRWRNFDGCSETSQTAQSGVATTQVWSQCWGGTGVTWVLIQGGSHGWPGRPGWPPGSPDALYNASSVIWAFFAAHPAPPPQVYATFVDAQVKGAGVKRQVLVSLTVGQPSSVAATLTAGTRKVASRVFNVSQTGAASLILPIPRSSKAKHFTLTLGLTDTGGKQLSFVKKI